MNIVVSDNKTVCPKNLDYKSLNYMTYEMFNKDIDNIIIKNDTVYFFDVDGMPEELYASIEKLIKPADFSTNFILFKYGDDLDIVNRKYPSFIKVKVIAFEPKVLTETDKYIQINADIRLNAHTYITNYGSILVTGDEGTGKTELLINIAKQLSDKGINVDFITEKVIPKFTDNENCNIHSLASVAKCAEIISDAQKEMMNRYKLLEKEQVNNVNKLSSIPQRKVIIIDDLQNYTNSDDYKSVDSIKQALGSIARLGKAAGIHTIISCVRPSGSIVSTDLRNNFNHFIHTGHIYSDPIYAIYIEDESKTVIVPKGYAYYYKKVIVPKGYKFGYLDDLLNATKFKINDVK